MTTRCEDFPCCGHTFDDPCGVQPYDAPGYYDTTIRGNEHALCDHENGDCDVYEDECEGDFTECPDGGCSVCWPDDGPWEGQEDQWLDGSYED